VVQPAEFCLYFAHPIAVCFGCGCVLAIAVSVSLSVEQATAVKRLLVDSCCRFWLCSIIWSALRIGAFLWMTTETDVWADFGGWLFGSIMIFLSVGQRFITASNIISYCSPSTRRCFKFAAENKEEQLKRSRAETFAQEAQLKMLRYQLNPHFLFNTLNAISALVVSRSSANANTMIMQLSNFLRYSLENDPD